MKKMQQMSGLDYAVEVKELQSLAGSRFDKFYVCADATLRLKLKGKSSADIVAENGTRLHISEKIADSLEKPPQFAMVARKHLENLPLIAVEQAGSDRIVQFTFADGKKLVFELFAKGNCILVDENGKIIDCLKREAYASRKIGPNQPYVAPPAGKKSIAQAEVGDLEGKGKAVALLSNKLSCGTTYLEDAVALCSKEKNAEKMSAGEKKQVIEKLQSLTKEFKPTVYYSDAKPIAFAFCKLKSLEENESKTFPTFWQALEEFYANVVPAEEKTEKENIGEKLQRKLEFQLAAQREFEEKASEAQRGAELLYANHELIEKLLSTARQLKEREREKIEIASELEKIAAAGGKKLKIEIGEKGELIVEVEVN